MIYHGRDDGSASAHDRIYKRIHPSTLDCANELCSVLYEDHSAPSARSKEDASTVALIGFASDIGVERNHGRTGAAAAPAAIREKLANFAASERLIIKDYGDIKAIKSKDIICAQDSISLTPSTPGYAEPGCADASLENADYALFRACSEILAKGEKLVVLGGSSESSFAPICALANSMNERSHLGVIHIGQHLNLRTHIAHDSGNSFALAHAYARKEGINMHYLCLGAAECANTQALWRALGAIGGKCIKDVDFELGRRAELDELLAHCDEIYLSISIDAIAGLQAASAPACMGVSMARVIDCVRQISASKKVKCIDIVELAPSLAQDNSVGAAALLAYTAINELAK